MLTIQLYRMEGHIEFLRCKICQKQFPRYDQRGFRNAGFTTHQNKCIEREYLMKNPVIQQQSAPKRRILLPAPSKDRKNWQQSYGVPQYQNATQTPSTVNENTFINVSTNDSSHIEQLSVPERIFPILQCDYCVPEYGMHHSSCTLLADIIDPKNSDA
ncbi:uncharacterized protein B0P05DRAFT_564692 [Gilbertella persicaria]|uniref:uncharacterized protein n=1 Tax=Gilbertella persicaria TaxID=101096 RepID=UPI0022205035|nr:uncharacterized protein B0P05DRAFT_564692 [Gilbertella persicaria]KAI8048149.1 hypothetical protein B0P05DRAFT_564692 [Gilbertella persicaria]